MSSSEGKVREKSAKEKERGGRACPTKTTTKTHQARTEKGGRDAEAELPGPLKIISLDGKSVNLVSEKGKRKIK